MIPSEAPTPKGKPIGGKPTVVGRGRTRKPVHSIPDYESRGEGLLSERPIVPRHGQDSSTPGGLTLAETQYAKALMQELALREKEAIRLYIPTDVGAAYYASTAHIRLAVGGNRGGKTLMVAEEIAELFTRQRKYKDRKRGGRAIFVGYDLLHCSKVMYRKLFKPGPFTILQDPSTGEWRTFDPRTDAHLKHLEVEAPALIPHRFYDPVRDVSWDDKKEEVPKTIRLNTGWEITFFSGLGVPPKGWDVDIVWFDEEIPNSEWLKEMLARLADRKGKFIWSCTPQKGTVQLLELSVQAEAELGLENPRVEEFSVNVFSNPFMDDESRDQLISEYADDPDEYDVRILGKYAILGQLVYPELRIKTDHSFPEIEIPKDWCRYVAIDPGRQVAAALFCAVPPPDSEWHGNVVFYDEVYHRKSTAATFADAVAAVIGKNYVHGWLIDNREGRKHETGSGERIEHLYSKAFRAAHLDEHGFKGFIHASDDVSAGITAVKSGLYILSGRSRFLFRPSRLKFFEREARKYVDAKHTQTGIILDSPIKRNDHLMDTWRYLALHRLMYVTPPMIQDKPSLIQLSLEAKRRRRMGPDGDTIMLG